MAKIIGCHYRAKKRDNFSLFNYALDELYCSSTHQNYTFLASVINTTRIGYEVLQTMGERGALAFSKRSICLAVYLDNLDLIQMVVRARARTSKITPEELYWALVPAVYSSDRRVLEYLVSLGVETNAPSGCPT